MAPYPGDPAVGSDQHGGAKDPLEGSAIHGLFSPCPIRLEHLVPLIGDQGDREPVLVAKRFLPLHRVRGDAEHCGSAFREGLRQAREIDRLARAPGSVGLGVEEEHQFFAGKVRKGDATAAVARQTERRCLCTFSQTRSLSCNRTLAARRFEGGRP